MASMRLLTSLVALAALISVVDAHGRLTKPASRNLIYNAINFLGNANAAVGGGPGLVHAGGGYLHGICGDGPGGTQTYNQVGALQATYTAGQVAEFKLKVTAHHMGFFEFELCDDAGRLSEECFAEHRLLKEGCPCSCPDGTQSCAACDRCRQWWKPLMSEESAPVGYAGPTLQGRYLDEVEFTMRFVIPAGVRTSNGVIRWHYMTTNSCTTSGSTPEEFWNCADVAISDGSSTGPAVSFDNEELGSKQPDDLRAAIDSGMLKGVYSTCPSDMIGSASDYAGACGAAGELCVLTGGSAEGPTSDSGYATPLPIPAPAGAECDASCNRCVAVPGNPAATQDAACAPCAMAKQTWWPCRVAGLCQCADARGSPTPQPPAPTYPPTAPPTNSPTAAPIRHVTPVPTMAPTAAPPSPTPAVVATPACQGRCAFTGCLATNNVCYAVDKSWCDARASLNYVWCEVASLAEVRSPKVKKHAFLGTALLQAGAFSSRAELDAEL